MALSKQPSLKLDKFRNNKTLSKKGFNKDKSFFICWDGSKKNLYICILSILVIVMWMWLTNGGTPSSGGGAEESSGEITLFPPLFLQNKYS